MPIGHINDSATLGALYSYLPVLSLSGPGAIHFNAFVVFSPLRFNLLANCWYSCQLNYHWWKFFNPWPTVLLHIFSVTPPPNFANDLVFTKDQRPKSICRTFCKNQRRRWNNQHRDSCPELFVFFHFYRPPIQQAGKFQSLPLRRKVQSLLPSKQNPPADFQCVSCLHYNLLPETLLKGNFSTAT